MNRRKQLRKTERLPQKPPTLQLQPRFLPAIDESAGDHQNRKLRPQRLQFEGQLHPRSARHIQIGNQQINLWRAGKDMRGPLRIARAEDTISLMLQKSPGKRSHVWIVVHQKDRAWRDPEIGAGHIERHQRIILHGACTCFRSTSVQTSAEVAEVTALPTKDGLQNRAPSCLRKLPQTIASSMRLSTPRPQQLPPVVLRSVHTALH